MGEKSRPVRSSSSESVAAENVPPAALCMFHEMIVGTAPPVRPRPHEFHAIGLEWPARHKRRNAGFLGSPHETDHKAR
jgi:hypothetical protein